MRVKEELLKTRAEKDAALVRAALAEMRASEADERAKASEAKARTDNLTNLPNRASCMAEISKAHGIASRTV